MAAAPISDSDLAELVAALPASPRLLAELAPRLQQVEVPVEEVTELMRRDPALTARLISVANSAAYARAEPATTLEDAVTCIGFREAYRVVGAVSASELSETALKSYGIEPERFRQNSLFVALVMEELADSAGAEPRAAYTMGLLRSIGKVGLECHGRKRDATLVPLRDEPLLEWEKASWGCTSTELAKRILNAWRFPQETVDAVGDHYEPGADSVGMAHLLNLAAGAADLRGFGLPGEGGYWQFTPESFARTAVDEGRLVWAGERAFRTLQRITGALG